jgi:predicted component of type VI protein secretion system
MLTLSRAALSWFFADKSPYADSACKYKAQSTKLKVQSTKYKGQSSKLKLERSQLIQIMHGANRAIVNPAARLLPDQSHFVHHLETVAEQTNLAALVVVPTHRHFFQFKPARNARYSSSTSNPNRSTVAASTADGTRSCERFEAALRVPERQPGRQTNDEIENSAALFAAPRLMDADQFAVEGARAKRHVALPVIANRIDQFRSFGYRS